MEPNDTEEELEEEKRELERGIKKNFFMNEMSKMCRYAMAFQKNMSHMMKTDEKKVIPSFDWPVLEGSPDIFSKFMYECGLPRSW
jgi:hypothetical protein